MTDILGIVYPSGFSEDTDRQAKWEKSSLASYLESHCIPVGELYANDFDAFMKKRQQRLMELVSRITGHLAPTTAEVAEEGDDIPVAIAHDSGLEVIECD